MMRSMFSSVSGLKAHQTKMDVIGNNIANINTIAFKSSTVSFQEVFSQTLKNSGVADANSGRGGSNPMQIGLGISIAAIDTIQTSGSLQRTDNTTDLAINGSGFFVVMDGLTGEYRFTRAGNFGIDQAGNLVTSGGLYVCGWQEFINEDKTEFDTGLYATPINIYKHNGIDTQQTAPKATTRAVLSGNLNAGNKALSDIVNETTGTKYTPLPSSGVDMDTLTEVGYVTEEFVVPYVMYDDQGNSKTVNVVFIKNQITQDSNGLDQTEWFWYAIDPDTQKKIENWYKEQEDPTTEEFTEDMKIDPKEVKPDQGVLVFDSKGKLVSVEPKSDLNKEGKFCVDIKGIPKMDGSEEVPHYLDFSGLTQYKADNSVKATSVDGYPAGRLVSFSINEDGIIMGTYSNGVQQPLAQISLAYFDNPAGLEKVGTNLYRVTTNSGTFDNRGYKPGSGNVGTISSGMLEMSNVDLSKEFIEMITTQRGFQANSKIISTTDEMLQDLVNLKR